MIMAPMDWAIMPQELFHLDHWFMISIPLRKLRNPKDNIMNVNQMAWIGIMG